jgi:hypothetical protein
MTTAIESTLVFLLASVLLSQVGLNFCAALFGMKWIECISRNPEAESKLSLPGLMIIGAIEITNLVLIGIVAKFLYVRL